MPKISEGKTGPHFRLSGMPSMPVMPRQRIASRSFGAMSEKKLKKMPKVIIDRIP
jgi:hypothetical protein